MLLGRHLGLLHGAETELARAFDEVAGAHGDEVDVPLLCSRFAGECREHLARLTPFAERYREEPDAHAERLHAMLFGGTREGPLGLLRDLHDLHLQATEAEIAWVLTAQAAQGARDADLLAITGACEAQITAQRRWLRARMKQAAPQALVVAR